MIAEAFTALLNPARPSLQLGSNQGIIGPSVSSEPVLRIPQPPIPWCWLSHHGCLHATDLVKEIWRGSLNASRGSLLPSVSIVIAAFNEEASLASVFERCLAVLRSVTDDFEIVILNDGSTDRTAEIMSELQAKHPDVLRLITHEVNRGIGDSFEALYAAATKDYVFDVPADGEYPPEALSDVLPLTEKYDIIVCNRTMKHYNFYRRIVSSAYRWLTHRMFGVNMFDPGSIKCRKKEVITDITVTSKGVFREAERLIRAHRRGFRLGKVDIAHELRVGGVPRGASWRNVISATTDLIVLWIRLSLLREKP